MTQINKVHIQTERIAARENRQLVLEMNYVLPDNKARITSIVDTEVVPVLSGAVLTDDTLSFNISADCTVIYDAVSVSEEEEHRYSTSLGFTKAFKENIIFNTDPTINPERRTFRATATLDNTEVTLVSDRKISVRAYVTVNALLKDTVGADAASSFDDEKVITRKKTVDSMRSSALVRTQVMIKEDVKPEGVLPPADLIVCRKSYVNIDSKKNENGKIVIYGTLHTDIAFADTENEDMFHSCSLDVNFSHAEEMPDASENAITDIRADASEISVDAKENGIFTVEGLISMEIEAYEYYDTDIVEDAFVPDARLEQEKITFQGSDTFILQNNVGICQEKLKTDKLLASKVIFSDVTAKSCTAAIKGRSVYYEGRYLLKALYVPQEDKRLLRFASAEIPFSYMFDSSCLGGEAVASEIVTAGVIASVNDFGEISLRWNAFAKAEMSEETAFELITSAEEKPAEESTHKAIYYHFMQKNETAWDAAKRFGVAPDVLCRTNGVASEEALEALEGIVVIKE